MNFTLPVKKTPASFAIPGLRELNRLGQKSVMPYCFIESEVFMVISANDSVTLANQRNYKKRISGAYREVLDSLSLCFLVSSK